MKETMKRLARGKTRLFAVALAMFAVGFALRGCFFPPNGSGKVDAAEPAARTAAIWTCSMHPQIKLPKAGQCPICFMDLIPLDSDDDEGAGLRELSVSENAATLMEIETVPVERRVVTDEVRMVGKVDYDETRVSYITAWVPGRLDRLFVDYTGVAVRKGDRMVSIYSPDLLSAQEELLQAVNVANARNAADQANVVGATLGTMVDAAREKLRLWGLAPEQIEAIERRGKADDHVTIHAPAGGIVVQKNAQEGMYVKTGMRIYTIVDLTRVWINLDAYESDLAFLRHGQPVKFTTEAYAGESFAGTISFIQPVLDEATRTVKVRVDVPNEDGRLKPGMFVRAVVEAEVGDKPLVIPASAPLLTGKRAIVYVQVPGADRPTFEGREIVLGPRAGDDYLVKQGLKEGDRVVTKGNFKLDAELQIRAKPSMMTPEGGGGGGEHAHHSGTAAAAAAPEALTRPKLPAIVESQLHDVIAAAHAAIKVPATTDLDRIRTAYRALQEVVAAVNAASLSGHFEMLWKEYSMLLSNDAAVGREVKTPAETTRLAAATQGHIDAMQAKFGLMHGGHSLSADPAVDPEFQKQLGAVVEGYLKVQAALAADDHDAATGSAKQALEALGKVDMGLVTGDAHMDWMKHAGALKTLLTDLAGAAGIEPARAKFALLSEQVAATLERFGVPEGKLYKAWCPMAFDNRGASWIQNQEEINNPYFGSTMLRCGEIKEVLK